MPGAGKAAGLLFLILAAALPGCGKKSPPVAPESSAPEAVADLRGWAKAEGIFLNWGLPSRNRDGTRLNDLEGFLILRQARPLGPSSCPECPLAFDPAGRIDLSSPKEGWVEGRRVWWLDRNVKPANEYTYRVIGYNRHKTPGAESNRVALAFDRPPTGVSNVGVKPDDRRLEVRWEFIPRRPDGEIPDDPGGFNVYRRGEGEDFGFLPLNPEPISGNSYVDLRVENGKRYEYAVRALRNFRGTLIEGPAAQIAAGIPQKTAPPSRPTGLVGVMRREEGRKGAELRWNPNPEADIAGYDLYREEKGGGPVRVNTREITEPYFFDRGAEPGETYVYRLRAVDRSPRRNESEFSQEAEVGP